LKSLEEYERDKQKKKRLIKDSLNNPSTKAHFKFGSDDDDEDNQPKEFRQEKIQLFDDNEVLNVEEHFNDKKVPKKRKQLQDLQAQLTTTNDPRFQFSEQFLDEKVEDDGEEISMEEEKRKSLAILDQMTSAKSKPKTKMIRFDPSKTEHRIYELGSEINTNGDNLNSSEDIKTKSILKQTKEITAIV
jgi:hypothetical protein